MSLHRQLTGLRHDGLRAKIARLPSCCGLDDHGVKGRRNAPLFATAISSSCLQPWSLAFVEKQGMKFASVHTDENDVYYVTSTARVHTYAMPVPLMHAQLNEPKEKAT